MAAAGHGEGLESGGWVGLNAHGQRLASGGDLGLVAQHTELTWVADDDVIAWSG